MSAINEVPLSVEEIRLIDAGLARLIAWRRSGSPRNRIFDTSDIVELRLKLDDFAELQKGRS